MISIITLGVLAVLTILGLAKMILKDFRAGVVIAVAFICAVIGLNFINPINIGGVFSFRIGSLLFYLVAVSLFFFNGKLLTQMTALSIALILGGVMFAASQLAVLWGSNFFANSNFVYAIFAGIIAFVFTRNGKYSFIVSATSMLMLNLLVQIGRPAVSMHLGFDWTVIAVSTSAILYAVSAKIALKPSRMSYFFEAGRLED